jgi:hypothetical protein
LVPVVAIGVSTGAGLTPIEKRPAGWAIPAGLPSALRGKLDRQTLQVNHDQAESFMGDTIMRMLIYAALFALPAGYASVSVAHGGGLNAEGCHNNRKTGGYHCHRGQSAQPTAALRAVSSNGRREFANCAQARAAGAAPVRVGDPGYGRHLDRDGDGVGCE